MAQAVTMAVVGVRHTIIASPKRHKLRCDRLATALANKRKDKIQIKDSRAGNKVS
jgi:hypothetical protein